MPTVRVVLRHTDTDGKIITKRYPNATAHVNPTTSVLQVFRSRGSFVEDEEMIAEFHSETYLYWK